MQPLILPRAEFVNRYKKVQQQNMLKVRSLWGVLHVIKLGNFRDMLINKDDLTVA